MLKGYVLCLTFLASSLGLQEGLGEDTHVIRTMPNTPAMIGEGMTVWSQSSEVTEEQHDLVHRPVHQFPNLFLTN